MMISDVGGFGMDGSIEGSGVQGGPVIGEGSSGGVEGEGGGLRRSGADVGSIFGTGRDVRVNRQPQERSLNHRESNRPIPTGPRKGGKAQGKTNQSISNAKNALNDLGPAGGVSGAVEGGTGGGGGTAAMLGVEASMDGDVEMGIGEADGIGSSGSKTSSVVVAKKPKKVRGITSHMGRFIPQPRQSQASNTPIPRMINDEISRKVYEHELKRYYAETEESLRRYTRGVLNSLPLPRKLIFRTLLDHNSILAISLGGFFYDRHLPPPHPGTLQYGQAVNEVLCVWCGKDHALDLERDVTHGDLPVEEVLSRLASVKAFREVPDIMPLQVLQALYSSLDEETKVEQRSIYPSDDPASVPVLQTIGYYKARHELNEKTIQSSEFFRDKALSEAKHSLEAKVVAEKALEDEKVLRRQDQAAARKREDELQREIKRLRGDSTVCVKSEDMDE